MELLKEQENILEDPAPAVVVTELADSSVNLSVRFWAKNEDFWDCHWYTIEEAKSDLKRQEYQYHSRNATCIFLTTVKNRSV